MKTMTLNKFKEQYSGNEIGYFYLSDENNLEYKLFSEEIKRETKLIYLLYNNEDLFLGTISSLTMKQNLDLIKRGYYKQPTFNRVNILLKEQLKMKEKIYIKVFSTTDIFTITLDLPGNTRKNINIDFKNKSIEDEEYVYDDDDNLITNFAYNRIIYGAPGTGKSYKLQEEVKNTFKDITYKINYEESNDFEENITDKNVYACGFKWEDIDKKDDFLQNNIWINGYNDGKLSKTINDIEIGDILLLKSSFTRKIKDKSIYTKKEVGEFYSVSRIFAIGEVTNNLKDGRTLKVNWKRLNKEYIEYPFVYLSGTIKKVFEHKNEILKDWGHLLNYFTNFKETFIKEEKIMTTQRVTFYDGYTYGQFVGTYKPVPCLINGIEAVSYKYIPGIFMKQLINAYKNPDYNFCLIIEEINRAKADRVFGNIFQLLDRQENGQSEYRVAISDDQKKYLEAELSEYNIDILNDIVENGLYIPKNMYIWATMNSADQGVYPLDSAFKRRWNFEYIGLDDNSENFISDENNRLFILNYNGTYIKWNDFREIINNKLLENNILEDRLIAPFFIKKSSFEEVDNYLILNKNVFADKILMYLFDDILRHSRKNILFKNGINSFSQMKKEFKNNEEVFNSEIAEKIKEKNILANNL